MKNTKSPTTNLTKRIIPCLDIKSGRVVKGINFEGLKDAGDPIELGKKYSQSGADELVFLDITATNDKRKTLTDLVSKISQEIFIPFTVGGGINSIEDIRTLLLAGADKVSINSAAIKTPQLIKDASTEFGSQCIVVAVDVKKVNDQYLVFSNAGQINTGLDAMKWSTEVAKLGAGEILLTSMDADGTKNGFDCEITKQISATVPIPVIASGGAGEMSDFVDVLRATDAALAASIFHYGEIEIPKLKQYLKNQGFNINY